MARARRFQDGGALPPPAQCGCLAPHGEDYLPGGRSENQPQRQLGTLETNYPMMRQTISLNWQTALAPRLAMHFRRHDPLEMGIDCPSGCPSDWDNQKMLSINHLTRKDLWRAFGNK